jgi:hypothetical protein
MAEALHWVSTHPSEARAQALRGRDYVEKTWERKKVFADLKTTLEQAHAGSQ